MGRLKEMRAAEVAVRFAVVASLVTFWLWVRFLSGWFYASEVQTGLMMLSFCLVGIDLSIDQRKQARRQSTDC